MLHRVSWSEWTSVSGKCVWYMQYTARMSHDCHCLAGLVVLVSALRMGDLVSIPAFAMGIYPSEVMPVTWKLVLQWLRCQAPGTIGSVLGLVGPVSVYCDWVRQKVWSAISIPVWQNQFGYNAKNKNSNVNLENTVYTEKNHSTTLVEQKPNIKTATTSQLGLTSRQWRSQISSHGPTGDSCGGWGGASRWCCFFHERPQNPMKVISG